MGAVADALDVVKTRVEKPHPHFLAGELELLAKRDRQAAREDLSLPAHRGRSVDDEVVQAPRLVGGLLARVIKQLAVDRDLAALGTKGTGRVVLRQRLIKLLQLDKRHRLLMVLQASGGSLDALTVLSAADQEYLQSQRVGRLL